MIEKAHRQNIPISEEIYSEFRFEIDRMLENDPFAVTKPLKYKVGDKVWFLNIGSPEAMNVKKCESGVYLVCTDEGKCKVCREDEIGLIN